MGINNSTTELTLGLVTETRDAIMVESEYGEEVWLPKTQLREFVDHKDGSCTVEISEELATEKGLV